MTELNESLYKEKVSDTFENITLKGDKPVVIKFGTEWCGPCKRLKPVLNTISEEYSGRVDMYDVDAEDNPTLASGFGIQSVPTIVYISKDGSMKTTQGAVPKPVITKEIEELLK